MDHSSVSIKRTEKIIQSTRTQVGDGFHIRRALPHQHLRHLNPFLVLDHAGPTLVEPSDIPKGVDEHPHRGFETVTILYQGALRHRDSAGNMGEIVCRRCTMDDSGFRSCP